MRKRFLLTLVFILLYGCGGSGGSSLISSDSPITHGANGNPRFAGDSMSSGWDYNVHLDKGEVVIDWNTIFKNAQNDGIPGATLEVILANLDLRYTPVIISWCGVNNLTNNDNPETVQQIADIYAKLILSYPTDRVIGVGIPLVNHALLDGWAVDRWGYRWGALLRNEDIIALNSLIKAMVGEKNFVDTVALLDPNKHTNDGLHPNEEGYKIIAQAVYDMGVR